MAEYTAALLKIAFVSRERFVMCQFALGSSAEIVL